MQLLKHLLPRTRGCTWRVEIETSNKGLQIRVAVKRNLHAACYACTMLCHPAHIAQTSRSLIPLARIALTKYYLLGLAKTSSVSFHMLKWTGSNVIWAISGT